MAPACPMPAVRAKPGGPGCEDARGREPMPEQADDHAVLAAAQERALARLASLEREFGGIVAAARDAGADDEHDSEGATLAFERQHVAALADAARVDLAEI